VRSTAFLQLAILKSQTSQARQYGGAGYARWGDYSWAVADGGSLWLATEYIPGGIDSTVYFTDFGTFIYELNLH
jgi:hypothetical protein